MDPADITSHGGGSFNPVMQMERLASEFRSLQDKLALAKTEVEKAKEDRVGLQHLYQKMSDQTYSTALELRKQEVIVKKYQEFCSQLLVTVQGPQQAELLGVAGNLTQLSSDELTALAATVSRDVFPKFPGPPLPACEAQADGGAKRPAEDELDGEPPAKRVKVETESELQLDAQAVSQTTKVPAPPRGLPRTSSLVTHLPHGDVVCAATFNHTGNCVFTGGKGTVKIWDLNSSTDSAAASFAALGDAYVRSCKLTADSTTLVVSGESSNIAVCDLGGPLPRVSALLNNGDGACYATAFSSNYQYLFACCNDGGVRVWNMHNQKLVKTFTGHTEGVTCIDVSPDGTKILTGSLDRTMRVWDLKQGKELASYNFPAQIFGLGVCPGESWVALGLQNGNIEVLNLMNAGTKYQLHLHDSCVLSLKFAHSGKWFISTSKDKMLNAWKSPFGSSIFQTQEPNSIMCCDISHDDSHIVTGSGERLASVYKVHY